MENGKSIGTVIGEALRPSQPDILGALRESIRELDGEIAEEAARLDDLRARRYDLFAEEDRIRGDLVALEYHRAEARHIREGSAESRQAVHLAFVRFQAARHLEMGTVPPAGSYAAEEVEVELDRQRAEVRQ